jgi:methanogenic corrinoid protein MtbC1
VVVAAGCGERHDLGLSMVSDFLRRDGWHVVDLGADVPEGDLAAMAARIRPGVCLLSATRVESLDAVRAAIGELQSQAGGVAILVGGAVFARDPSLATTLGATGTADNAQDAVDWVRQYLHA